MSFFSLVSSDQSLSGALVFDYCQKIISTQPNKIGIIIRKQYLTKNETGFGYYRKVNPQFLKRICFKYLEHLSDVIAFLHLHATERNDKLAYVFIENLNAYFDNYVTKQSTELVILMNCLNKLSRTLKNNTSQFGLCGFTMLLSAVKIEKDALKTLINSFSGQLVELTESAGGLTLMRQGKEYSSKFVDELFRLLLDYKKTV